VPIYEYWCNSCQRKISLYRREAFLPSPRCPHCGSDNLTRLFSTFSMSKTDKGVYEDILSDSQLTKGMLGNDPRALSEWNKRMSRGEKAAPEYEEMVERMGKGEWPTEIMEQKRKELTGERESKLTESE